MQMGVMVYTFSLNTWKAKASKSLCKQGEPSLQNEFQVSQGYTASGVGGIDNLFFFLGFPMFLSLYDKNLY